MTLSFINTLSFHGSLYINFAIIFNYHLQMHCKDKAVPPCNILIPFLVLQHLVVMQLTKEFLCPLRQVVQTIGIQG